MDKNTMLGLLLMGAVILGFMWLNQPEPNPDSKMPREELTQQQSKGVDVEELSIPNDTLSQTEMAMLVAAVKEYGNPGDDGKSTLSNSTVELISDGSSVAGTVKVDSFVVNLSQLGRPGQSSLPQEVVNKAVSCVKETLRDISQYRGFAKYLRGEEKIIKLENELVSLDLSTKGAMISRAVLKKYDSYKGGDVTVFENDDDAYSFILTSVDREFNTGDFYFTPVQESDTTVLMTLNLASGTDFGIRYTLAPESYVVKMDIVQNGMQSIIPSSVVSMDFLWNQKMIRQEEGRMFEERNSAIYYKYAGGDVENLKETSNDSEEVNERVKWIGYKNQFFSTVFIARNSFTAAEMTSKVLSKNEPGYLKDMSTVATLEYSAQSYNPASFDLYIGPNLYPLLSDLQKSIQPGEDLNMTRLIPLGWTLFLLD